MPFGVGDIGAVGVPCHTARVTNRARLSHFQTVSYAEFLDLTVVGGGLYAEAE